MYGTPRRTIVQETWFWVAMAGVLLIAILAVIFVIRWTSADARGQLQAREQILSGKARIAAYNHFFDLCAAVQSDEASIVSLNQELTTGPSESRREQIQASLTALRAARVEKINSYNADARKDYTIGQFRDLQLPYTINKAERETSCIG
jgi:hypothetical protein